MSQQDLKQCNSPDAAIVALIHAAGDFHNDGANLDAYGQNGEPWRIIAEELDKAIGRMVRRVIASGYPIEHELRELAPQPRLRVIAKQIEELPR
jgi:hypothetical protein